MTTKLEMLVDYTFRNRQVGHTFTTINGLKDNDKALLIVPTKIFGKFISARYGIPMSRIISLPQLDLLRGRQNPIVIDHTALEIAFKEHMEELEKRGYEP